MDGGAALSHPPRQEAGLAIGVLGPLEVCGPQGRLPLGGRRNRALLALLALDANRAVSTERLIEGLWGEEPPPTAIAALQNAVSQLRKVLELAAGRPILHTRPGGYLLEVEPEQIDLHRFEGLVAAARRALADGRPRRAVAGLRDALDLWRGPPLGDLSPDSTARAEITRLEELRLGALEDRVEAELALGRHAEVVGELRALVAEHPYRERLWAQLMLALYRSGRQADALDAYQRARKVLAEELGIEPGPDLQQLEWSILNQDPRLQPAPPSPPTTAVLPAPPTPFIGRRGELERVVRMLRDPKVRLLTLTGPPGTGKTRLALAAAAAVVSDFDHMGFAELAPLSDPELVVPQAARAIGLREQPGETPAETLRRQTQDSDVLVILDNFEHLLAAATSVAQLLTSAPRLKVLVTSRTPLRLYGEWEYVVPPLAVPDLERLPDLEALSRYDALALFVERAQAAQANFELTVDNAAAVAEVCVRLDGLPLAIELAAARLRVLSPEALLARLRQRLQLLTGGPRDVPARQQTLRAAIDWSHSALDARQQTMFARLAVFAGGWTLEAAEAVCNRDKAVGSDVVEPLGSLLEQSLLRREDGSHEPRFGMLESMREYALERLEQRGEEEALREAHADYFVTVAEEAYGRRLDDESAWAARLEAERDNLRAALDWLAANDPSGHLQLAGALGWYWHTHSRFVEGRERLDEALGLGVGSPRTLARALTAAGTLAGWQGDTAAALPMLEAAIARWEELGEPVELALALEALAYARFMAGAGGEAATIVQRSIVLHEDLGRPDLANRARLMLCQALISEGETQAGEVAAAEALASSRARGDLRSQQTASHFLGDCALVRGDVRLAGERYREALRLACQLGYRLAASIELQGVAMAAAGQGRARAGICLEAAAEKEYAALGVDPEVAPPFWKALLDRYLGPAREELGDDAGPAWEEGRQLSFEEAVEKALNLREC